MSSIATKPAKPSYWTNFTIAFLFIGFLLFIDEGYYNFKWAKDFWNWVFFFIYLGSAWAGQIFANEVILKNYRGKRKNLFINLIGIPIGIIALLLIGFSCKALVYGL